MMIELSHSFLVIPEHYANRVFMGERCGHCQQELKSCTVCGSADHDPCLGHIEGVKFACCGHGIPLRYSKVYYVPEGET